MWELVDAGIAVSAYSLAGVLVLGVLFCFGRGLLELVPDDA